ncbi:hydroxyacid dehydrogenase [Opitutaceae bacterium TAV4]|uniref:hydroxyacid dehydrogenase n=1 Tax=Geminisphaera colitermitum TaxID=1148786 RepID=UPI000158C9FE|nr:hydroxyacid dehydrogenase [Geminisphaera colitermitum]RRJ96200.1 hydroxyacid dehydrogenase [Opitutaceae bacterium TAV4]RRK00342.1 hydroxyacid dehydrogenase [Opitutaceae bacterium TAV3]
MIAEPIVVPPPSPARACAAPAQSRVLFAIVRREQELFIPGFSIPETFANADCVFPETLPTRAEPAAWRALLEDVRPEVLVSAWRTPPLPADWINGSNGDGVDNEACPLRYICHLAGSVRQKVPRAFLERGGLVTNWGGQVAEQVAEHALLLALSALRRAPAWMGEASVASANKMRITNSDTRTLFRRRIGVHGCGGVARALASLLRPFTDDIACFSTGVPADVIRAAGMHPAASLSELFTGRDVLFECEALTPANTQCVDAAMLARLPDGALFVNVARGHLVDETALLREVRSGRLQAALDVLTIEPVPADSPWRKQPGAIYSPHIAGPTNDMMPRIGTVALQNVENYLARRPLTNLVTLEQYDRAT